MDLDTKVTIPDHVLFNRVGDEAVLLFRSLSSEREDAASAAPLGD